MQAKHPKGFLALQLAPATLAFDVEDPGSHYAPRMELRVTGDVVGWLRALDAKAAASPPGGAPQGPPLQAKPAGGVLRLPARGESP